MKAALTSFFHRNYTLFKAVDQVSFQVDTGEILGVLGANGAGKTTMLKCLIGLLYPTPTPHSSLQVLGHTPSKRERSFLRKVSIVLGQKNQLWWDLPPVDSFELHRHLYQIPHPVFKQRLEELVTMLDVSSRLGTQVRRLSLGERMKMEIIASLLHQPEMVLLDEPTIGLDLSAQRAMRSFIKQYNRSHKTTFLITSHYMRDIEELCSRVLFVDQGRLIYDGNLRKLARIVPQDDKITAVLTEKVSAWSDEELKIQAHQQFQAQIEITGSKFVGSVSRDYLVPLLTLLSTHRKFEDLEISAVAMEEAVNAIYKDPSLLQKLKQTVRPVVVPQL